MKKYWIVVLSILGLAFLAFTVLRFKSLSINEAILLGEEKFLEFEWMVYGAFNNDEITVNNKKLPDEYDLFKCEYSDNKNKCLGYNFEESFNKLFSKKISYNNVYGDNLSFSWYEKVGNDYYFSYPHNCSIHQVSTDYTLKLVTNTFNKITYEISYLDNSILINNKGKVVTKQFILIKENNVWKIGKAFYRDVCMMNYNIS